MLKGDDRPRLVCEGCGFVFYLNPKLVAGVIPVQDGRAVLLRRGIEPRRGAWTYPGGFVELGETVEEAACREAREEIGIDVQIRSLLNVYSRVSAGVVVVIYLADIVGGEPQTGREAIEVRAFAPEEIPWEHLAFPTTEWALREWVQRLREGRGGPETSGTYSSRERD